MENEAIHCVLCTGILRNNLVLIFNDLSILSQLNFLFMSAWLSLTDTVNTISAWQQWSKNKPVFLFAFLLFSPSSSFGVTNCHSIHRSITAFICWHTFTSCHSPVIFRTFLLLSSLWKWRGWVSLNNLTNMHSKKWHAQKDMHVQAV